MEGRRLSCQATSAHFERKLSRRFSLTDELLQGGNIDPQQDSVLLNMPYEVQMLVFESLNHAPSQVSLALTCKKMSMVASEVNLSRAYTSRRFAGLLPKEVFDVPDLMKQLSSWMPEKLRLCDHCLTARPCNGEYWSEVEGCSPESSWVEKVGWSFGNASWHKQIHNICPSCHISCTISDYVDCDGCRSLGRLGDIDWSRVSDSVRKRRDQGLDDLRMRRLS